MRDTDPLAAIARFLAANPEGADAARIAREVLCLSADGARGPAAAVVRALLSADARFLEADGVWRLAAAGAGAGFVAESPPALDDVLAVALAPAPARSIALARCVGGRARAVAAAADAPALRRCDLRALLTPEPACVVGFDARALRALDGFAPEARREALRDLAGRALDRKPRSVEALAEALAVAAPLGDAGPAAHALLVARLHAELAARTAEPASSGAAAPLHGGPVRGADAAFAQHAERLLPSAARHRLPQQPGVYVFRDGNGRPLYVGKAKDLRRRLLSHFSGASARREAALHAATARITHEVLGSEGEALLREFALIARHAPEWNRQRSVGPGRAGALPDDLLLILPTPAPSRVRLYAARKDGAFLEKDVSRVRRGRTARSALESIAAFFFGGGVRPRGRGGSGAPRIALLLSWYRVNRDRVTVVRPARLAGRDDLLRVLAEHLADPDLFAHRSERV
jgi:predicted GIY-YIG superfamily endonuclease